MNRTQTTQLENNARVLLLDTVVLFNPSVKFIEYLKKNKHNFLLKRPSTKPKEIYTHNYSRCFQVSLTINLNSIHFNSFIFKTKRLHFVKIISIPSYHLSLFFLPINICNFYMLL